MKIVTVSQMQKAERDCADSGISLNKLMDNAGEAVAKEMRSILGDLSKQNVLVLVGPGNNGGDGLVAARYLYDWGVDRVKVYLCGVRPENDRNFVQIIKRSIHFREIKEDSDHLKFHEWLTEATTVLDSVFGTGKSRPISGDIAQILNAVNKAKKHRPDLRIVALDLPSGLNADTGAVDPATPFADNTVTLGYPKIGLYHLPGAERVGAVSIADIGIPAGLTDYVKVDLLSQDFIKTLLPSRSSVSHKGTYGKVMAVVGSANYIGAAYLACTATIRVGAGLATLAVARSLQPILASKLTEVTYLPLPESGEELAVDDSISLLSQQLPQYDVLLLGCGIGQSQSTLNLLESLLLDTQIPLPALVLDADGINLLSRFSDWWKRFNKNAVLTPHAGEMSRLFNKPLEEIQANRIYTAQEASAKWNKTIVLKGAFTAIASPDGRVRVSPFANAGLASAGTGDVLAGAVAGMAAQGLSLFDAASCGVYLHGLAGEIVKGQLGDAGMLASDLLPVLPRAIKQLKVS
jgi:ADP-dependent NAD(P)H-hydrate dehydratase / NAD(P)H-hydrate epimerase